MTRNIASLLVFAAFAVAPLAPLSPDAAKAMHVLAPVTFGFTGVVTSVSPGLGSEFSVSELLVGEFTFESTTADSDPGDPTHGDYNNAITTFTATFGGDYTVTQGLTNSISVLDGPTGSDSYSVFFGSPTAPTVAGLDVLLFTIGLIDTDSTVFATDALPLTPPDLSLIEADPSALIFQDSPTNQVVNFDLTSFTVIPEPSTLALAAFGFAGLLAYGWRRRRTA